MPNRREGRNPGWDRQEEWEPSGALSRALEEISLLPGADRNGDPPGLEAHLQEALGTLERLERRRGLSVREKARAGALGMLLESIGRGR